MTAEKLGNLEDDSLDNRRILHEDDELVDDTVPGFRVKVSEIFA
jgi:hypothetical protein